MLALAHAVVDAVRRRALVRLDVRGHADGRAVARQHARPRPRAAGGARAAAVRHDARGDPGDLDRPCGDRLGARAAAVHVTLWRLGGRGDRRRGSASQRGAARFRLRRPRRGDRASRRRSGASPSARTSARRSRQSRRRPPMRIERDLAARTRPQRRSRSVTNEDSSSRSRAPAGLLDAKPVVALPAARREVVGDHGAVALPPSRRGRRCSCREEPLARLAVVAQGRKHAVRRSVDLAVRRLDPGHRAFSSPSVTGRPARRSTDADARRLRIAEIVMMRRCSPPSPRT